ncbi:MAG: methyltransferase domain-containing protein, partial [bacterium]|nr:methyltransferase domain-containing protein [bacterium]
MFDVYDKIAPRYDRMHATWLRYAGGEAQAAFEAAVMSSLSAGMRILDAGSGTGRLARHIVASGPEQLELTLVDRCRSMLSQSADLPVRLVEGCLMALPFENEMFDLVSAAWSVESTPNPARVVRELLRVLRPGGQLVLVFLQCRAHVPGFVTPSAAYGKTARNRSVSRSRDDHRNRR